MKIVTFGENGEFHKRIPKRYEEIPNIEDFLTSNKPRLSVKERKVLAEVMKPITDAHTGLYIESVCKANPMIRTLIGQSQILSVNKIVIRVGKPIYEIMFKNRLRVLCNRSVFLSNKRFGSYGSSEIKRCY